MGTRNRAFVCTALLVVTILVLGPMSSVRAGIQFHPVERANLNAGGAAPTFTAVAVATSVTTPAIALAYEVEQVQLADAVNALVATAAAATSYIFGGLQAPTMRHFTPAETATIAHSTFD